MRSVRNNAATAPGVTPPPPENCRAYVVRAVNLKWQAKRSSDGEVIVEQDERAAVSHEARRRGYFLTY